MAQVRMYACSSISEVILINGAVLAIVSDSRVQLLMLSWNCVMAMTRVASATLSFTKPLRDIIL